MWKALIALIEKLSCKHEWKEVKEITVYDDLRGTYYKYLFVCKKCGKLKWLTSRQLCNFGLQGINMDG